MRKSRVVSLKKFGFGDFIRRNIIILSLCLIFIIGVLTGTLCYVKNQTANHLASEWFVDYISFRGSNTFFSVAVNSALSNLLIGLCVFACGCSMIGVALVPSVFGYLGFKYGSITAYIYAIYQLKGIAFNAIILIPPTAIFLVGLFFASRSSVEFSFVILKLSLPKSSPRNLSLEFKAYCGKFLIFLSIIVIVSFVDAALCKWFIKYFNF